MTNIQLLLTIGIPTVAVLIGILVNQNGFSAVNARLDTGLSGVNARLNSIEGRLNNIVGDLRRFYQILGEHGGKIELLEKHLPPPHSSR